MKVVIPYTPMRFIQGNCLDKLQELEDNSIDCVVSSPPYFGLRDYGVNGQFGLEKTYQEYIANTVKVFETFKPKLKETATIWWNIGDSYKNKNLLMIPNRVAIALQDAGWFIRSEIIWQKTNCNPESTLDRPTNSHEKIWLITKSAKYYYDAEAIKEPQKLDSIKRCGRDTWNSKIGKFKYAIPNVEAFKTKNKKVFDLYKSGKTPLKNKRNVWSLARSSFRAAHFATFPIKLIEPCIKAGCPENGTVLDPFAGAGTVGLVCKQLNREAILIELNPDYIEIAKNRINENNNSLYAKEATSLSS